MEKYQYRSNSLAKIEVKHSQFEISNEAPALKWFQ